MTFGVYIHYPYCRRLCPYCDFNVFSVESPPDDQYRDAVVEEINRRRDDYQQRHPISSIYFGGGTPGMWSPACIADVVAALSDSFGIESLCEITVEFNPEDAQTERLQQLLKAGVNRLSFGLQSFDDEILVKLGRAHCANDALRALRDARAVGFDNLSVDLIFGLQGQSVAQALDDVMRAVDVQVEHISTYQLTIEDKTPFGVRARRGESLLVDEARLLDMFERNRRVLVDYGYTPYEISSAARPGYESVHNQLYWSGGEYLALGAGAHGFRHVGRGGIRWENIRNPRMYMSKTIGGKKIEQWEDHISADERLEERLWTGLRLLRGVEVTVELDERFGTAVRRLVDAGLMSSSEDRWCVTDAGRRILDTVISKLVI